MRSPPTVSIWIIALATFFSSTIGKPLHISVHTQPELFTSLRQTISSSQSLQPIIPYIQRHRTKAHKPQTLEVGHVSVYSKVYFTGQETSFTVENGPMEKGPCYNFANSIGSVFISDLVICFLFKQKGCISSGDEGEADTLILEYGGYGEISGLPWEDEDGMGVVGSVDCYLEIEGGADDAEGNKEKNIRWPKREGDMERVATSTVADELDIQEVGKTSLHHSKTSDTKLQSGLGDLDHSKEPSSVTNTAVTLYLDYNFRGVSQRVSVIDDECYDLDSSLQGNVLSMTIEDRIWYCAFFPATGCQGDTTLQVNGGRYDDLYPDGYEFVSFKCRIYGDKPESVVIPLGVGRQDELNFDLKH